jgi:hypothetical protein
VDKWYSKAGGTYILLKIIMGKMWRDFSKKRAVLGLAIFVIIVLVWWANIIPILNQRYQEYKVLSQIEKLKQAYRDDTLGGATPEETLKMFITAFKAGDLKLASKYFIPEKQAEYLAKMQNWVKVGKKEEISKSLENSKMLGQLRANSFVADMGEVDRNNRAVSFIEFVLNKFTGKWNLNNM